MSPPLVFKGLPVLGLLVHNQVGHSEFLSLSGRQDTKTLSLLLLNDTASIFYSLYVLLLEHIEELTHKATKLISLPYIISLYWFELRLLYSNYPDHNLVS